MNRLSFIRLLRFEDFPSLGGPILRGHVTGDPGDIDNRILVLNGETYDYAADNKRIRKTTSTLTQWYLWVGNMRVGTYTFTFNSQTSQYVMGVVKEDLYVAGRRVAPSDRLGSDVTGGVRLMPYGEDIASPPVANDRTKFATYHRDASGYDYADQRYYSPGSGRFVTGDPYQSPSAPGNPSGWNRYAYVTGDPINKTDRRGLDEEYPTFCDIYVDEWYCSSRPVNWDTPPSTQQRQGDRSNLTVDEWVIDRTRQRLGVAIEDALIALGKEKCASLFSTPDGAPSPSKLLQELAKGTSGWGYLALDKLEVKEGSVTSATTNIMDSKFIEIGQGAQQMVASAVLITINLSEGTFQDGNRGDRLATLIHEIGHAYYDLFGSSASKIVPDGPAIGGGALGVKVSEENTERVRKNCL